jgi:hypothetical protein
MNIYRAKIGGKMRWGCSCSFCSFEFVTLDFKGGKRIANEAAENHWNQNHTGAEAALRLMFSGNAEGESR